MRKHGTRSNYNAGCRCADCTWANTLYARNRRKGDGARTKYEVGFEAEGKDAVAPHGTWRKYFNAGCRCDVCRSWQSNRSNRARQRRWGKLPAGDERHGTANGYFNWGCRCEPCKEAGSEQNRRHYYDRRDRLSA